MAPGTPSAGARPARIPPTPASRRRPPARALPTTTGKGPFPRAPPGDRQKGPRAGRVGEGGEQKRSQNLAAPPAPAHPAASRATASAHGRGEKKALSKVAPLLTRGNEEPSGRQEVQAAAVGWNHRRTHLGSTRSRPGAEAPGMVRRGLATHPGSTRGRLSGREELARSARRQPSLWRHTPPAPTYRPAPDPRDPPRRAPSPEPRPRDGAAPPAGVPNRVSPTAAFIGRLRAGRHAPSGELVHVGRASPVSAASPWRLCRVSPHRCVTGGGRGGP